MSTWDRAVNSMLVGKDEYTAEEASNVYRKDMMELEKKYREVLEENCQLKRVVEELRRGERMDFPETFDEYAQMYKIVDTDEVYTNGIELIPVFRVKQWLEHEDEKRALMRKLEFNMRHSLYGIDPLKHFKDSTDDKEVTAWDVFNRDGFAVKNTDEEIIFESKEGI